MVPYSQHLICVFLLISLETSLTFIPMSNCGSTFFTNSGQFSTPTFNNSHNRKCHWRISAKPDERITLNITEIDIEKAPNCSSGSVEVRDGYWKDSPLLGRYCGTGSLNPVKSIGNKMFISYSHKSGNRGFTAKYEASCGGTIHVRDQLLLEPFQNKYPLDKNCVWEIIVPDHHKVVLKFRKFEVEEHETCFYDYVEVSDSENILGKFCGDEIPDEIISTSNNLFIKFVSDSSVQKEGFSLLILAEYNECGTPFHGCSQECVNTVGSYKCACRSGYELHSDGKQCILACGGVLTAATGEIMSPSFPEFYPPNKTCTWEVVVDPENLISLNFNHFDVEEEEDVDDDVKKKCKKDKLRIYSKTWENRRIHHGSFCGNVSPSVVTSESNSIVLVFSADNSVERTGFSLNYFTFPNNCDKHMGNCHHNCTSTSVRSFKCVCPQDYKLENNQRDCAKNCHFEIASTSGYIQSPGWPSYYPRTANCSWSFKTTPGFRIKLDVVTFRTEDCHDFVKLYDGHSISSNLLVKWCGSLGNIEKMSTKNELFLTFNTDSSNEYVGFEIKYSAVCGGNYTSTNTESYIYSHAEYLTQNYTSYTNCEWRIVPPQGYSTRLSVETFDIEDSEDCEYDFLEIFEEEVLHGRFCGVNKPLQRFVSNSPFTVRFQSDGSLQMKGFRILYKAVL